MNWFAVLAHHATRTPDKAMTVFEGETTTYGEMATRAAALGRRSAERGVGRGDVVALLSYNCPEFLETVFAANYLGAIAMPINWRLAAPEVRYILEHSEGAGARVRRVARRAGQRRDEGHGSHARAGVRLACRSGRVDNARRSAGDRRPSCARVGDGGRRRPPADVHVGHHRAPQGRDDHPRQPGVEEPRAHHRVRLHQRAISGWPAGRSTTSARSTSRRLRSSPPARPRSSTGRSTPPPSSTSSSDHG